MAKQRVIVCPICSRGIWSLGYARHRAMHMDKGEIKGPQKLVRGNCVRSTQNSDMIYLIKGHDETGRNLVMEPLAIIVYEARKPGETSSWRWLNLWEGYMVSIEKQGWLLAKIAENMEELEEVLNAPRKEAKEWW